MCGISGIWKLSGESLSEREITTFNRSLAHREPDGAGIFLESTLWNGPF
jgi:asparagine synthetase B (glutamine-hydrolysing)